MFMFYWISGLIRRILWTAGIPVSGTAPTLKTSWSVYGLSGRKSLVGGRAAR